jgi:hypothetical protein
MKDKNILFLGNQEKPFSVAALKFCKANFKNVDSIMSSDDCHMCYWGRGFTWDGDYIISV